MKRHFCRRKADSDNRWKPETRRSQERIGELGLVGGEVPPASDMTDAVRKPTGEAEDSGVEEVPMVDQPQGVLSQLGRLDDYVRDGDGQDMCQPTVGATARLMRTMGYCEAYAQESVTTRSRILRVEIGRCRKIQLTRHFSHALCAQSDMCILTAWLKTSHSMCLCAFHSIFMPSMMCV